MDRLVVVDVLVLVVWALGLMAAVLAIATGRVLGAKAFHQAVERPRLMGLSSLVAVVSVAPIVFQFRLGSPEVTLALQLLGGVVSAVLAIYAYKDSGAPVT